MNGDEEYMLPIKSVKQFKRLLRTGGIHDVILLKGLNCNHTWDWELYSVEYEKTTRKYTVTDDRGNQHQEYTPQRFMKSITPPFNICIRAGALWRMIYDFDQEEMEKFFAARTND